MNRLARELIKKQYPLPRWYKIIVIVLEGTVITLIGVVIYKQSGWPDYNAAVSKCGGKQPVEASTFIARTYAVPGDPGYRIPGSSSVSLSPTVYFCSEAEAASAGYQDAPNNLH